MNEVLISHRCSVLNNNKSIVHITMNTVYVRVNCVNMDYMYAYICADLL